MATNVTVVGVILITVTTSFLQILACSFALFLGHHAACRGTTRGAPCTTDGAARRHLRFLKARFTFKKYSALPKKLDSLLKSKSCFLTHCAPASALFQQFLLHHAARMVQCSVCPLGHRLRIVVLREKMGFFVFRGFTSRLGSQVDNSVKQ